MNRQSSNRCGDDDFNLVVRAGQTRFDSCAWRSITFSHPGVPGFVHLAPHLDVGQPDIGLDDPGLVGAGFLQGLVNLGKDIDQPSLKEEGASEIVAATRAFNIMQHRIRRYIDDRERLFSSISHDLKTPITRLRLRVELLDDEAQIAKFNKDLDELELMVKGALQTVKETDIHENLELIDINALLEQMAEAMNLHEDLLTIEGHCKWPYRGKLLALKRCIGNLVDNGIKYGHRVRVILMDDEEMLILFIMDEGPGLPEDQFERIFEPYYRLSTDLAGTGLGLGIARNIAHAHGGDLVLENRPQGGLQATLSLPRQ